MTGRPPGFTRDVVSCDHDWRLYSREWVASVGGPAWHEVWYCTRCRFVDEQKVEPGSQQT